jgi:hypothetical protein
VEGVVEACRADCAPTEVAGLPCLMPKSAKPFDLLEADLGSGDPLVVTAVLPRCVAVGLKSETFRGDLFQR